MTDADAELDAIVDAVFARVAPDHYTYQPDSSTADWVTFDQWRAAITTVLRQGYWPLLCSRHRARWPNE